MPKLMVIRIIMSLGAVLLSRFRTLRALFITGYVLNIILWFVPSERFSYMAGEITSSRFDLWFGTFSLPGDLDLLLIFALVFASNFVFIALALALPRRWVFITASSVAALFIVVNLITTYLGVSCSHCTMTYILVPRVLQRVASQLTLLGFFIKPPAPRNSGLDAT